MTTSIDRGVSCYSVLTGDVSKLYGKVVATATCGSHRIEFTFEGGRKITRGSEESMTLTSPRRTLNARMEWVLPSP